jgi:hypothetical protein
MDCIDQRMEVVVSYYIARREFIIVPAGAN